MTNPITWSIGRLHLFYSLTRLKQILKVFEDHGQFEIETSAGTYRGEISRIIFRDDGSKERLFEVEWAWFCVKRIKLGDFELRRTFWEYQPRDPRVPKHTIKIKYRWFYIQEPNPSKKKEMRVKLLTTSGERCRFYKNGDITNPQINHDGELVQSPDYSHDP